MSSTKKMIFAAALMLSAVNAENDVTGASNGLQRALQSKQPITPARRFNLEAMMVPTLQDE